MTNDNILSDSRRKILNGASDWDTDSIKVEKSRIRSETDATIDELIEIAKSPEIENESVFDSYKLGMLLHWIIHDPYHLGENAQPSSGTTSVPEGADTDLPEDVVVRIPEELVDYAEKVYIETNFSMSSVEDWARSYSDYSNFSIEDSE